MNFRISFWSHVWLMPSRLAQLRPDGFLPRAVSHWNTYLRIKRASSRLRQGCGGRHTARAFARFCIEDSCDGIVLPAPSPPPTFRGVASYLGAYPKDLSESEGITGKLFARFFLLPCAHRCKTSCASGKCRAKILRALISCRHSGRRSDSSFMRLISSRNMEATIARMAAMLYA
jgi:hypothetical protein